MTALLLDLGCALLIMVGAPVVLAVLVCRRGRVPTRVVLIAAGFFLLNLVVNVPLTTAIWPRLFGSTSVLTLLMVCLTYGVCEELARYASFRLPRSMRSHRTAIGAVAAGVGHGGTESILFGLQLAAAVGLALWQPGVLGSEGAAMVTGHGPLGIALAGLERLPAMACHVGFALLVVAAFRRSLLFLPVAVVLHAGLDFLIFGLQLWAPGPWSTVVFFALGGLAVAAVATAFRLRWLPRGGEEGLEATRTPSVPPVRN